MQMYVQDMVSAQIKKALDNPELATKLLQQAGKHQPQVTEAATPGKSISFVKRVVRNVKSPSDTTIYAPALNLTPVKNKSVRPRDKVPAVVNDDHIAEFIQNIRLESNIEQQTQRRSVAGPQLTRDIRPSTSSQHEPASWKDEAREFSVQLVAESNQQKADTQPPTGKVLVGNVRYTEQVDDEFFPCNLSR